VRDSVDAGLLGFKYWIDQPDDDMMCYWSEHHQIMFHSAEYLAGQRFATRRFDNSGLTGAEHMQRARRRILRWIDLRARIGFAEWNSNTYYDEDMTPLLNLADFAADGEVARRAAALLDVMFACMALDSFRGTFGTTHGRSYPAHILDGHASPMAAAQNIAWGMGVFHDPDSMTASALATSRRWRVPMIVERMAQAFPDELEHRECHGLRLDDRAVHHIDPDDPDGMMLLWGMGLFAERRTVAATIALADRLRSKRFSVVIRPYAEAVAATYAELDRRGIPHDGDLDRTSMTRADTYTFRTPDYQLSCAQDYRKGKPGFQQHIWQATLGPSAVVFSMHRGAGDDQSGKYWVGRFPRAVQYRNVLIALYDIPELPLPGPPTVVPTAAAGNAMPSPAPSQEALQPWTIAVLRRAAFDEVRERAGWVFARRGAGYLALFSHQPARWTRDGALRGEGLIAPGRRNRWICQLGRAAVDGAFATWCERIATARLSWDDAVGICYEAPGVGQLSLGWDAPLRLDGSPIAVGGHPRMAGSFASSAYSSAIYRLQYGDETYDVDLQ